MQWPLLWLAFQVQIAPSGCPIQIPGDSRATILKSVHRNQSNLTSPKSSNVSNESKIVQIFQFWVHTHRLHNWKFGTAVCVCWCDPGNVHLDMPAPSDCNSQKKMAAMTGDTTDLQIHVLVYIYIIYYILYYIILYFILLYYIIIYIDIYIYVECVCVYQNYI